MWRSPPSGRRYENIHAIIITVHCTSMVHLQRKWKAHWCAPQTGSQPDPKHVPSQEIPAVPSPLKSACTTFLRQPDLSAQEMAASKTQWPIKSTLRRMNCIVHLYLSNRKCCCAALRHFLLPNVLLGHIVIIPCIFHHVPALNQIKVKQSVLRKFGCSDKNTGAGLTLNKQYKSSF